MSIFILDHDEEIVDAMSSCLQEEGYIVRGTQYEGVALSWLQQGYVPSLMIMDADLYDIDGKPFYQHLMQLEIARRVPLIAMADSQNIRILHQPLSFVGVLMKPFSLKALLWSVGSVEFPLRKIA